MPYYANSGQVIATSTEGISIADVASALASTYLDVASLCTYEIINKWSKVKPVRGTWPGETDFSTNNAGNQTGIFAGARGVATDFPVYWGMKYPMNSALQNSSRTAKKNLLELCYDIVNGKGNHPNYEYVRPVIGTDFCRLTDFNGYYNHGEAFLDAGVSGAKAGTPAEFTTHIFQDGGGLTIYALIPSDSIGWNFKDLVPDPANYYLVAEFYKNDNVNVWKSGSTADPVLTVWSSSSLASVSGGAMFMTVPFADIRNALDIDKDTTTDYYFYACVGFNKKGNVASAGFVAPWEAGKIKCATFVRVMRLSPYSISISKYAPGNLNSPTAAQYVAFPTAATTVPYDWVWLQTTVTNNSDSDMVIWLGGTSTPTTKNRLKFRVYAYGSYPTANSVNAGYVVSGNKGKSVDLRPSLSTNVPDTVDSITIPAKQSKTVYFKPTSGFLPHGSTSTIFIEVYSESDESWANTGNIDFAGFNRN